MKHVFLYLQDDEDEGFEEAMRAVRVVMRDKNYHSLLGVRISA